MRRVRLLVEYDGAAFYGFQRLPDRPTVQAALERHLSRLCNHPVRVVGAGRTDAGVHALGQVVHFDTTAALPAERIAAAASALSAPDLVVRHAEEAPAGFHARNQAVRRSYHYHVARERPSPVLAPWVTYARGLRPDAAARMREALPPLVGTRDFAAFGSVGGAEGSTVRTVLEAALDEREALLRLRITAGGFLHHMVRIIAGLLLEIGRGRRAPGAMAEALEGGPRPAGPTAPPQGLFLMRVEYPDGFPGALALRDAPFFREADTLPQNREAALNHQEPRSAWRRDAGGA